MSTNTSHPVSPQRPRFHLREPLTRTFLARGRVCGRRQRHSRRRFGFATTSLGVIYQGFVFQWIKCWEAVGIAIKMWIFYRCLGQRTARRMALYWRKTLLGFMSLVISSFLLRNVNMDTLFHNLNHPYDESKQLLWYSICLSKYTEHNNE